jgi:hypothetical protein
MCRVHASYVPHIQWATLEGYAVSYCGVAVLAAAHRWQPVWLLVGWLLDGCCSVITPGFACCPCAVHCWLEATLAAVVLGGDAASLAAAV